MDPRAIGVAALAGLVALAACVGEEPSTVTDTGASAGSTTTGTDGASSSGAATLTTTAGTTGASTSSGESTTSTTSTTSTMSTTEGTATSDATGTTGPDDLCGDGVIEAPEVCDDGNHCPNDGCDPACASDVGAVLWFDTYLGVLGEHAVAFGLAARPAGEVVVVGVEREDGPKLVRGFVREYAADGALVLSETFDPTPEADVPLAVVIAANGDLVISGRSKDPKCSDGCGPGFVARLDPAGALLWTTPVPGTTHAVDLAIAEDGGIYVAGAWIDITSSMRFAHLAADGALLWDKNPYPPEPFRQVEALEIAGDGSLIVGGFQVAEGPPPVHYDAWYARLTADGEPIWTRTFDGGEGGNDVLHDLAIAEGGDLLLTGRIGVDVVVVDDEQQGPVIVEETTRLWLARAGPDGALLWSTSLAAVPGSAGEALAIHPEHVVVAGSSSPQGECEVRLTHAIFAHDGALRGWSGAPAGSKHYVNGVALVDDGTPTGALYLAGGGSDEAWVERRVGASP